ncbi:MAG TPA: VWA domain-containing protein [Firmicutes bacterium]|nr:VWA domain-containing protein [Bacillota bacterium]
MVERTSEMTIQTETLETTFMPYSAETGKELKLKMQELYLSGRITPVGARLAVRHVFVSSEKEPGEVVYAFMLPRDAALRSFRVESEGMTVHSELKPVEEAEKEYEKGIRDGHLATLAKAYRDGLVNLNVGNVLPDKPVTVFLEIIAGVELHDDGFRFRFPFTIAPSYHPRACFFDTEQDEGEIGLPPDEFADIILPKWKPDAKNLHRIGFDISVAGLNGRISEIASPSHKIRVRNGHEATASVSIATGSDIPNRDLVLDAKVDGINPVILTGKDSTGLGRIVAILPSCSFGELVETPRKIVFLVDRSGSMSQGPMEQAKNAVLACLGALSDKDEFGIIAFDTEIESFRNKILPATVKNREKASEWLKRIDARGGTELGMGIEAALECLGNNEGEIVLFTDGQVFGGDTIIRAAKSSDVRVHALGIGSASQDRFLSQLATETGGVSRFMTPNERVDMASLELFASIGRPIAEQIECSTEGLGNFVINPKPPNWVFSGTPFILFGIWDGESAGEIIIKWKSSDETKSIGVPVSMSESGHGEDIRLFQGAKIISATELMVDSGDEISDRTGRRRKRVIKLLEELSMDYGLASLAAALVAVMEREGDISCQVPKTEVVPVGMPDGVIWDAYFGSSYCLKAEASPSAILGICAVSAEMPHVLSKAPRKKAFTSQDDILVELAMLIQPDGGMDGDTFENRCARSVIALLAFFEHGSTEKSGAFKSHIKRLIKFLENQGNLDVQYALEFYRAGNLKGKGFIKFAKDAILDGRVPVSNVWDMIR